MAEYVISECVLEEPDSILDYWRMHERIVRCKDCEHATDDGYGCTLFGRREQGASYRWEDVPAEVEPDGFCKWGVRRENE